MAEGTSAAAELKTTGSPAFSIVGIGASAGGLEAYSELLKHIPPDTGMAFVVIQHLDPKHASLLPELLAKITEIPVKAVTDEMAVEPNRVYVMPATTDVVLSKGKLWLIPREGAIKGIHMPIDGFFRSLAENCGDRGIGVVLSGTGSDGALGLEAIKAEGGFTFAQDVQSAKFVGMPHSAFATGLVDFVLPPEGIAQELVSIAKNPYLKRPAAAGLEEGASKGDRFEGVLQFLQKAAGVDFTQYRSSTIQRRVLRRMAINHFSKAERYLEYLIRTPGEVQLLCEEMIPRVTRFFRDPLAFEALQKKVFPRIVEKLGSNESIRIWVPGCASGEEAYAIAICLLEFLEERNADFPIQIFGTDLSAIAIQNARRGFYDNKIAEDVSPGRLQRYFLRQESGYKINGAVRETCIFANHDLIRDPPYSKLDLISCRNVLIYLDSVQKRIIPMFHHSLNNSGFLMLGAAETARSFADLFVAVDKKAQIYSRRQVARPAARNWGWSKAWVMPATAAGESWDSGDLQREADRVILARYGPSGVVVNENWQVLQVRGKVSAYLEAAPGKMSVNVIKMARRSGLAEDLSAALERAKSENAPVRKENLALRDGGGNVNLQVIPLGPVEGELGASLILFEEVMRAPSAVAGGPDEKATVPKMDLLSIQSELAATKERLLAILDRHQLYADETQSQQEESLSNLEEVQSFNEELETAKEELQSTNEELSTVNEELQSRNSDLQQAYDFATSVAETVREPQLVLDQEWVVKLANEAFYQTFQAAANETEGFGFFTFAQRAFDVPALRSALEAVQSENREFNDLELEIRLPRTGRRILRMSGQKLKSGLMTTLAMDDVTEQRMAEAEELRLADETRQGQKMEAIGRLAGGIAHDFNNLLTVILGFSQMLMEGLNKGSQAYHRAKEINKAGERAASLTHQLLAFSRRQVLQPQPLNMSAVVLEMEKMLRRLIGDNIALEKKLEPKVWAVRADPGQMGQVILNLALNARDAMPGGGVLTIRTANTNVAKEGARVRSLEPGHYVTLSITDSGDGMDPETQKHLFEPFYTTKPQGKGTGLGLATVGGIVLQSGGKIEFKSKVGHGTTFWVDLPRIEADSPSETKRETAEVPTGTETILVVEDEKAVRELAVEILRQLGYTVVEAGQASEALEMCRTYPSEINLLLTDVLMPGGISGRQLAEQVTMTRRGMKVLMVSGYTTDTLVHYGIEKGASFLNKPFTREQLARKVRDVLDSKEASTHTFEIN